MKKKATRKKKLKRILRHDILICPACGIQNEPDIWNGAGNYEEDCINCNATIQFHVEIEFDGVKAL